MFSSKQCIIKKYNTCYIICVSALEDGTCTNICICIAYAQISLIKAHADVRLFSKTKGTRLGRNLHRHLYTMYMYLNGEGGESVHILYADSPDSSPLIDAPCIEILFKMCAIDEIGHISYLS